MQAKMLGTSNDSLFAHFQKPSNSKVRFQLSQNVKFTKKNSSAMRQSPFVISKDMLILDTLLISI